MIEVRGERVSIPEISAYVLRHMKKIAEAALGTPVDKAVITVPANFNDAQRESTRIAGRIAGLDVIRIINEPTAASLAYGYGRGLNSFVAVYDFGGGTFDFTLLELRDRVFRVISTAGDMFLGGDDFDEVLATAVANSFWKQTGIELRKDVVEWQRLLFACERVKRELSTGTKARPARSPGWPTPPPARSTSRRRSPATCSTRCASIWCAAPSRSAIAPSPTPSSAPRTSTT